LYLKRACALPHLAAQQSRVDPFPRLRLFQQSSTSPPCCSRTYRGHCSHDSGWRHPYSRITRHRPRHISRR
jgi:hypothetical protein